MFDISEFDGKKIAILCETYEERDEFYRTMRECYPEYMKSWDPTNLKPLEYCYVAGWEGSKDLLCFTDVSSAMEYGKCAIMPYRELCGQMWEPPDLSSLFNDVQ